MGVTPNQSKRKDEDLVEKKTMDDKKPEEVDEENVKKIDTTDEENVEKQENIEEESYNKHENLEEENASRVPEHVDVNDNAESDTETSDEDTASESSGYDENRNKKKRKKPKRCEHYSCRTKLYLTSYSCYCESYFCPLHTPPEEHGCDFDYHGMAKKKIKEDNPKVVKEKVSEI